MPLRDARTVVPELVLLPPDPVFYGGAFEAMLDAIEGGITVRRQPSRS